MIFTFLAASGAGAAPGDVPVPQSAPREQQAEDNEMGAEEPEQGANSERDPDSAAPAAEGGGEAAPQADDPMPRPTPRPDPAASSGTDTETGAEEEPASGPAEDRKTGEPGSNDEPAEDGKPSETDEESTGAEKAGEPAEEKEPPKPTVPEPPDPRELAACMAELARRGAVFEAVEPVAGLGGCGIAKPVRLSGFASGPELQPAATVDCETAVAIAAWVDGELMPAAAQRLLAEGAEVAPALTTIRTASSYICRPRNNQDGAKLSEHGRGRALDIAGFEFEDGRTVGVQPRGDDHDLDMAFQAAVRKGACLHFTTVLGPGSAYHGDHLHLDLAVRRSGYRICE